MVEYIKFGTGNRTLVILPGLSLKSVLLSEAFIKEKYQPLTNRFTIYLFDKQEMKEGYTLDAYAQELVDTMQNLHLSSIYLYGISMGGMLAQIIACKEKNLVDKLILASTVSCLSAEEKKTMMEWHNLAKKNQMREVCLSFGQKVYPQAFFNENLDGFIAMSELITEQEKQKFLILTEAIEKMNITNQLSSINCQTMVIYDTTDQIFPVEDIRKIEQYTTCKFMVYEGYGHAVYDLAPDLLQTIQNF